ncbi:hypothetical protein GCM10007966_17350 [Legionella impletisoli]|uniref:Uncharacterized protein n=2 Tax=Legionella impletisoli TaxID=343510 RepID=A0A917NCY2_9GAMM|nr:hypothetical protein [Legionella impletisoli]GGI89112.1 hypothetical protein GCM10007966_17350 [Legionella impletisoli]
MRIWLALLFTGFISAAFAHRIVITGKPSELIVHDGYYSLPRSHIAQPRYHFITFAHLRRVCFIHELPQLHPLPKLVLVIEENGHKVPWNCYLYDPHYFEIDY